MALTVFTHSAEGHFGTKDPATGNYHDGPQKHAGCQAVAVKLGWMTGVPSDEGTSIDTTVQLRDGHGNFLPPIQFVEVVTPAREDFLTLVHPPEYLRGFRTSCEALNAMPYGTTVDFGFEAQVSAGTYHVASLAAQTVSDATDFAVTNPGSSAFALRWPPSHHAEPSRAKGYSYLNDVSAKAKELAAQGYDVVIVDLDNHDGDGDVVAIADVPGIYHIDMCQRSPFDRRRECYRGTVLNTETGEPMMHTSEYPYRHTSKKDATTAHITPLPENAIRIEVFEKDFKEGRKNIHAKGETPEKLVIRFVNEAIGFIEKKIPKRENSKGTVVFIQYGSDSLQGDPLGGMGHTSGSHYTIMRGLRLALPQASFVGVMQGGYHEEGWKRGIPAALMALHVEIDDPAARSTMYKRYGGAFVPSPFRDVILKQDSRGAAMLLMEGNTTDSPAVAASVNMLLQKLDREIALYERRSFRQRATAYFKSRLLKYGAAEIAGTATSLMGIVGATMWSDNPGVVGLAATLAENLGFYSVYAAMELRESAEELRMCGQKPTWRSRWKVLRGIVAKCGLAEGADTLATRPLIMSGGAWLGKQIGQAFGGTGNAVMGIVSFLSKFAADLVFYSMIEITDVGLGRFLKRRLLKWEAGTRLEATKKSEDRPTS